MEVRAYAHIYDPKAYSCRCHSVTQSMSLVPIKESAKRRVTNLKAMWSRSLLPGVHFPRGESNHVIGTHAKTWSHGNCQIAAGCNFVVDNLTTAVGNRGYNSQHFQSDDCVGNITSLCVKTVEETVINELINDINTIEKWLEFGHQVVSYRPWCVALQNSWFS